MFILLNGLVKATAWLAARKFLKYYIINMARNCISNIYSIDMKDERTFFKINDPLVGFWIGTFLVVILCVYFHAKTEIRLFWGASPDKSL